MSFSEVGAPGSRGTGHVLVLANHLDIQISLGMHGTDIIYIYNKFVSGCFSVRRTPGKFNKVPSDQCIEQAINREQKGHGGIEGYCTSVGAIQIWVITSHVISKCHANFESMLSAKKTNTLPKDLGESHIDYDNERVESGVTLFHTVNHLSVFAQV